jgi:hypothetical protein
MEQAKRQTTEEKNRKRREARLRVVSRPMALALLSAEWLDCEDSTTLLVCQQCVAFGPAQVLDGLKRRALAWSARRMPDGRIGAVLLWAGLQTRQRLLRARASGATFAHPRSSFSIFECSGGSERRATS